MNFYHSLDISVSVRLPVHRPSSCQSAGRVANSYRHVSPIKPAWPMTRMSHRPQSLIVGLIVFLPNDQISFCDCSAVLRIVPISLFLMRHKRSFRRFEINSVTLSVSDDERSAEKACEMGYALSIRSASEKFLISSYLFYGES